MYRNKPLDVRHKLERFFSCCSVVTMETVSAQKQCHFFVLQNPSSSHFRKDFFGFSPIDGFYRNCVRLPLCFLSVTISFTEVKWIMDYYV